MLYLILLSECDVAVADAFRAAAAELCPTLTLVSSPERASIATDLLRVEHGMDTVAVEKAKRAQDEAETQKLLTAPFPPAPEKPAPKEETKSN